VEKISVIVPVYNVEECLKATVESILDQTYRNLEIILIDDGSSDQSGAICDELAALDSRVVVIHQINGGVSKARNVGINVATGKYIGFCDADDYIDSDMYETLYKTVKKYNTDVAMVSLTVHTLSGKRIPVYGTGKEFVMNRAEAIEHFLKGDVFCYTGYCHLLKADLCKQVAFVEGKKMHEDRYYTFEILTKVNNISVNDICKYHYVLRTGSVTMHPFEIERLDVVYFADKILSYIKAEYPEMMAIAEFNRMRACWDVYKLIIKEPAANKKFGDIRNQMRLEVCNCCSLDGLSAIRRLELFFLKNFEVMYIVLIRLITFGKKISYAIWRHRL